MIRLLAAAALAALIPVLPASAATLVGSYGFNNSLASAVPGGQALTLIDPKGKSGFGTDTVFGEQRTVFNFLGSSSPSEQSGLSFNTNGLLVSNDYSVALTFKFNERNSSWRRILDVSGRTSDNGFYVDNGNNLSVFPSSGSNVNFLSGSYRNVVLTVGGGKASAFVDGGSSFSSTTPVMNLTNGPGLLTFFADNNVGGGQGEWSSGSIAALRIYNGVLSAEEIAELNRVPFVAPTAAVPEPATWAMMLAGFGLVGGTLRSRRNSLALA